MWYVAQTAIAVGIWYWASFLHEWPDDKPSGFAIFLFAWAIIFVVTLGVSAVIDFFRRLSARLSGRVPVVGSERREH